MQTKKTVLITGSAGFLGHYLVMDFIQKGYQVVATDLHSDKLKYAQDVGAIIKTGDLTNPDDCKKLVENVDMVVHSAAIFSLTMPEDQILDININATENICKAASEAGVERFIHVSSADCYGSLKQVPAPETHPLNPLNAYAKSKKASEDVALRYHREKGLKLVIVRPTAIYGPLSKYVAGVFFFFPLFMRSAGVRVIPGIKGGSPFQLVHVADVSGAIAFLADKDEAIGEVYNLAEPVVIKGAEFGAELCKNLGIRTTNWAINLPGWLVSAAGLYMYYLGGLLMGIMHAVFNPRWNSWVKKYGLRRDFRPHFERQFYSYFIGARALDIKKIQSLGYEFKFPSFKDEFPNVVKWYVDNKWIPDFDRH